MVWVKLLALWVDHVELVALKDVVQQFVRPVKTPKQAGRRGGGNAEHVNN